MIIILNNFPAQQAIRIEGGSHYIPTFDSHDYQTVTMVANSDARAEEYLEGLVLSINVIIDYLQWHLVYLGHFPMMEVL